ncbi:N-acetyltransferase [Kribbella albertanoniae]|uniref:N-acetyltransferase n=1 Tax=Kribbella albertanoniae TaxID=1266829 RepID=A0A4R4Q1U1_9ACTN|nr:N-acetyltransferase [Kribbella albertanoniae]
MPEHGVTLERLTADHADALLAFERDNRKYFAASIADRGDEFFAHFTEILHARLAEQAEGICHFHVLVEPAGAVVGRVNLIDVENGSAELGYRLAERVTGRGLATAAVRAIVRIAAKEYGLRRLTAGAAQVNVASWTVLERAGFELVATTTGERPQVAYELSLEGL